MGIRVIKTAVAVFLSITFAQLLHLDFPFGAGLLAVLGVEVTKRKGLTKAAQRILASIAGLFLGSLFFAIIGFYVWVVALYILVAFPLMAKVKLKDGIMTSMVVVLHVFSLGEVTLTVLWNEILLLLLGLGTATTINLLYMPNADSRLVKLREETETLFSTIFQELAWHLRDPERIWDGGEVIQAEKAVRSGKLLAEQASENSLFREEVFWTDYFQMRRQQLDSIVQMMNFTAQVSQAFPQSDLTAEVFQQLSKDVKNEFYTGHTEKELEQMEKKFLEMPLPETREEFEIRSAILQLCIELKHYLSIAKKEKKRME